MEILSHIGLFYLILIVLFGVPLFATAVVVIIKGIIDLQYAVMAAMGILFLVFTFFLVRLSRTVFQKFREQKQFLMDEVGPRLEKGESLEISFMNGLCDLNYCPGERKRQPDKLAGTYSAESGNLVPQKGHVFLQQIIELAKLREKGLLSETEYKRIKEQLIGTEPEEEQ